MTSSRAVPGARPSGLDGPTAAPAVDEPTAAPAVDEPVASPAAGPTPPGLVRRLLRGQSFSAWLLEVIRFCAVGGTAFVVDVGLFNLLRFGPGELLGEKPLTAKVLSVAVSVLVAWLGNRYWTFAGNKRDSRGRELTLFVAVNLGGMVIAVGCLAVSHYVLGLTSPLADNIAANGVGLVLGTAFRYVCYRYVVFTGDGGAGPPRPAPPGAARRRDRAPAARR
ncbi:GtrA family protein [Georgenia yuyongxinii]|uniref:GtrA family protein n=1 Tax=Georgenia yuyongxinii TaxID=2589797 RepID=UPI001E62C6DC|nr:GtrA family protein [Georgenia yuyongxinii]